MSEELSEINASAVKNMSESVGWKHLIIELNAMISDIHGLLEKDSTDDERNRGRIDAFRVVMDWPETVAQASYAQNLITGADDATGY